MPRTPSPSGSLETPPLLVGCGPRPPWRLRAPAPTASAVAGGDRAGGPRLCQRLVAGPPPPPWQAASVPAASSSLPAARRVRPPPSRSPLLFPDSGCDVAPAACSPPSTPPPSRPPRCRSGARPGRRRRIAPAAGCSLPRRQRLRQPGGARPLTDAARRARRRAGTRRAHPRLLRARPGRCFCLGSRRGGAPRRRGGGRYGRFPPGGWAWRGDCLPGARGHLAVSWGGTWWGGGGG